MFGRATLALLLALGPAAAAADEMPAACEARGHAGMVTLVLCQPGLEVEVWKAAGDAACDGRLPCGAWIWDYAAHLPQTVPERHDDLPEPAILSAVAIWVAEDQSLITLERVTE
jgi:hypothetical protein